MHMVKRIATIVLLAFCSLPASATQTLQTREMFDTVGTLTSGSPGSVFDSVTGTFFKRAVGPSTAALGSPGWSADQRNQNSTYGEIGLTNSPAVNAKTNGVIGCWLRFKVFANGTKSIPLWVRNTTGGGLNCAYFTVTNTGQIFTTAYAGTTAVGPVLSLNTWYYAAIGWEKVSGTTYNWKWYLGTIGSALTNIDTQSGLDQFSAPCAVRAGADGSGVGFNGRIGGFGLYSTAGLSDVIYPGDLVAPVEEGHEWFLDQVGGSDNNTGLSGSPWQTLDKLNAESLYTGMIDTSAGYAVGDSMTVASGFNLGTNQLWIRTRGLTLKKDSSTNYCTLVCHTNMANAGFSLTSGLTKVYESSDTTTSAVLWEDDKWLAHPTGSTLASVTNALETTAGSFWTDGTKMYVHPFDDTNPASDGKTYTRSIMRNGGQSAVRITVPDVRVSWIKAWKTCLAGKTDSLDPGCYGVQGDSGFGGTSLIDNCWVDYGGKHCIGFTDNAVNSSVTISNCIANQGSPYMAQTPFVSYNGNASGSGNQHFYVGCVSSNASGLIGSSAGTLGQVFISHNLSGLSQFSLLSFSDCYFPLGYISWTAAAHTALVDQCQVGYLDSSCVSTAFVSRTLFDYRVPANTYTGSLTVANCLIKPTSILNSSWVGVSGLLQGTMRVLASTVDLDGIPSSSTATNYIWKRNGALSFEFYNNIFKTVPGTDVTLIGFATDTDSILMTNNVYKLGTGSLVATAYDDGGGVSNRTLTQWQALGFDAGTVNQDPCLSSNYRPYAKTPTWNIGTKLGPLTDYTGKLFQSRQTVGAYEYVTPNSRFIFRP